MAISAGGYLMAGEAAGRLRTGTGGTELGQGWWHWGINRGGEMRAPCTLSCLFLLTLGACVPPGEQQELGDPWEGTPLGPSWRVAGAEDRGTGWRAGAKRRRSEELGTLLGIARALRGYRQDGSRGGQGGPEMPPAGGEKRSGTLGNLAEELNGYNRKKGGFTFRFGR
ncbi:orexigenic neuropeptide QRFP [Pterocles gutturalis]